MLSHEQKHHQYQRVQHFELLNAFGFFSLFVLVLLPTLRYHSVIATQFTLCFELSPYPISESDSQQEMFPA